MQTKIIYPQIGNVYPEGIGRRMQTPDKVCPVVLRDNLGKEEILAFSHPSAGKQFVKGTIEPGEAPETAARRELFEESGIVVSSAFNFLDASPIGFDAQIWHFFWCQTSNLPEAWSHETLDDYGHVFQFFWHPIGEPLNEEWDSVFHEAYAFIGRRYAENRLQGSALISE